MDRIPVLPMLVGTLLTLWTAAAEFGGEFQTPSLDRWMYPHNATPGTRPVGAVFSTMGDASGVDTRHGQFLMQWSTRDLVSPGNPRNRYLVTRVRLILTTTREGSFIHDPTPDAFESALPAEDARAAADSDPGRPVELFGAGYRNGYTADTFLETSPFGSPAPGERNAFAAGFNSARELVDVGNNVGKTNTLFPPFPSRPFAVGRIDAVEPGGTVPADSRVVFELQLSDPDVLRYVQESLRAGCLSLVATWLGESGGVAGTPSYPEFATRENLLYDPPRLLIEGRYFAPDDVDTDGLPDDWERFHLGGTTQSGDADPDGDGMSNRAELEFGTSPNDAVSRVEIGLLHLEDDGVGVLPLRAGGSASFEVEISDDLQEWRTVSGGLCFPEAGRGEWRSDFALEGPIRFFRLRPR